ncbi:penicillin-binding transpeptidase domain-containing protein [Patulibacter sp. NPDC049589]|uniref:penicillin-binding transpeptidase domain-containing protein n=1 Tax=Patulibacter sp. NPDC049589 TaxID=3154731 RepID=UPI0034385153
MGYQERTTPAPQLAIRIAAFGIIAFGVFAVLFLRLWFLQVLQGDQYVREATSNGARIVRTAAPRGMILDRDGNALVSNRVEVVVALRPESVPEEDRTKIADWGQKQGTYDVARAKLADGFVARSRAREAARIADRTPAQRRRIEQRQALETPAQAKARATAEAARRERVLSSADRRAGRQLRRTGPRDPRTLTLRRDASPELTALLRRFSTPLQVSAARLYRRVVLNVVKLPYANVPLKSSDIGAGQRNYLLERQSSFPELAIGREYRRFYPGGGIASQLYGNIGEIGKSQLREAKYAGLRAGQRIGQDGLEFEYNAFLQGKDGYDEVEVDAQGRPTGRNTPHRPVQGRSVKLSIDSRLQRAGERAIADVIKGGLDSKTGYRAAGSFVAIDPRNGELLADGSYPEVDLNKINDPNLDRRTYGRLVGRKAGVPLYDRASRGQYAIGSTFKIVTALAGLSTGLVTPQSRDEGGRCLKVGAREFCNAEKADLGTSNLRRALQVSSDVYFYAIGRDIYKKPKQPLQSWARNFGYGRKTGVDLPGELPGVIPDRAWREKRNAEELACRKKKKVADCRTVADVNGQFLTGDSINLSIGQGDFLATPLQVATAYSGLYDARGSYTPDLHIPTPHLGMEIQLPDGRLDKRFNAPARRRVPIPDASWKRDILNGLHDVTSTPAGTGGKLFSGWDQGAFPVYGKTGTAQRCADSVCPDQAWFAAMVPDPERPIVVVATVENGDYGATTAGPIVCRMLRDWYRQSPKTAACDAKQGSVNSAE